MAIKLNVPMSRETARSLKAGDSCLITGTIYTARDAAHKRLCALVAEGKELPFEYEGYSRSRDYKYGNTLLTLYRKD